jgi:hypothetical protein
VGNDDSGLPFFDPIYSQRVMPFGFGQSQSISNRKMWEYFTANPRHFTTNDNTTYRNKVTDSKHSKELVSALYLRGDLNLLERRLKLVGGVRVEQTNVDAEGPLNDPTLNYPAQRQWPDYRRQSEPGGRAAGTDCVDVERARRFAAHVPRSRRAHRKGIPALFPEPQRELQYPREPDRARGVLPVGRPAELRAVFRRPHAARHGDAADHRQPASRSATRRSRRGRRRR